MTPETQKAYLESLQQKGGGAEQLEALRAVVRDVVQQMRAAEKYHGRYPEAWQPSISESTVMQWADALAAQLKEQA